MFDLSGKRALVTGASGAIGAAIARALAAQGALVGLSGTRRAALQSLADEIGPAAARVLPVDLGEPGGPEALAEDATTEFGGIDILVNNAGITRDQIVLRMSDDDWNTVLAVDLSAPFRLTRALLRGMVKQRWGRIVGITSVVAATGSPGQTNYAAAKAGMIGMTKALAHEVASRGITANCVAPGFIDSAMTEGLPESRKQTILGSIPLGRLGKPEEIAGCVIFLVSDEGSYVTGQTLHVNGGMTMVG